MSEVEAKPSKYVRAYVPAPNQDRSDIYENVEHAALRPPDRFISGMRTPTATLCDKRGWIEHHTFGEHPEAMLIPFRSGGFNVCHTCARKAGGPQPDRKMTQSERKLLKVLVELSEPTLIGQETQGTYFIGSVRDQRGRASWKTYQSLKDLGYIEITRGAYTSQYVIPTKIGKEKA